MAKSSAARIKANQRYNKENLMRIVIQPHKTEGDDIKAAAERLGLSTQKYILEAVRQRMERENSIGG